MKKMPCLFVRHFNNRDFTISSVVTPGCEWVLNGEGIATRKRDGTACMIMDNDQGIRSFYKRYDAKRGKTPPVNGIPCDPEPDPVTGHWPHWIPVGDEPESRWHREAWEQITRSEMCEVGTYELCGPKLQGNPEGILEHFLFKHGGEVLESVPLSFEGLKAYLTEHHIEGIVWHHSDGRMCKLRRHDFHLSWNSK